MPAAAKNESNEYQLIHTTFSAAAGPPLGGIKIKIKGSL